MVGGGEYVGSGRRYGGRACSAISGLLLVLTILVCPAILCAQMDQIQAAAGLLSQGKLQQAEARARIALHDPDTRPLALAMLGTIRLQQQKYNQSINFLTRALALNPHLVGARTTLGDAYVFQGKTELARKSFQEVLRLDPANFNARLDLAKLEASIQKFRESLEIAIPIIPQLAQSEDGILLLATDYAAVGRKDELKSLVEPWSQLMSVSDESAIAFRNILADAGMTAEAKEVLETEQAKLSANPSVPLANALAKAYFSAGDLARAEQDFQLGLALKPDCAACNYGLAQIAEAQNNTEKALAYLIAAKNTEPDNPDILFEFGKVCLERDLLDDAVPALSKAVALRPTSDSHIYMLGSAYVSTRKLDKAAALFTQLVHKHPDDPVVTYALGSVYYLQGKYSEAEASLTQSLHAKPDQVAASYYLALTYDAVGQDDQAVQMLRDLVKSHKDHAPSYTKLATILIRRHQYEEARQDLERAIALDPKSVEAHYQLGLLLRRLGETAESDNQLAESRKLESERHAQTDVHLRLLLPN